MGGLFSAPSPPPLPPTPEPTPDPAIAEEKHRQESIARKRRGRRGLIATSQRGLLGLNDNSIHRPSLLGE